MSDSNYFKPDPVDAARDESDELRAALETLRRQLAIAESTRDSAQAASTRDILDARAMRCIVNAPPFEAKALADVSAERRKQDRKWGTPAQRLHIPFGMGGEIAVREASAAKRACDQAMAEGRMTWRDALDEERAEVNAESELSRIREELTDEAALCVNCIEVIDRLLSGEKP